MTVFEMQPYAQLAAFLHSIPGVGQQTLRAIISALMQHQIKPESVRAEKLADLHKVIGLKNIIRSIKNINIEQKIVENTEKIERAGVRVVMQGSQQYPISLERLQNPPFLFYLLGTDLTNVSPSLAVVGSRRCTPYGIRATKQIVGDCCRGGVATIVSGLMYGIDAHAHQVAITCNTRTIAVLGYGIGHWFPQRIQQLGMDIVQAGGALVSEYPLDMPPTKGTFLERNRLIAALADAVLVPEAAARSGTQRTVAVAADLGIPVGAVPGPFDSPFSQGTKACINEGATLVSSADDILLELGMGKILEAKRLEQPQHILEKHLQAGPLTTDELCLTTQLSVVQLSFELSSLELAGRIVRRGGQWHRV